MTTEHDPAIAWQHVNRLTGTARDAVVRALRHSAAEGRPASQEAARLLVAYAAGEITARQYADGILRSFGSDHGPTKQSPDPMPPPSAYVVDEVAAAPARPPAPSGPVADAGPAPETIRREDAVQAYVTGRIPVGEFLRIARS